MDAEDIFGLSTAIEYLLTNESVRLQMAEAARQTVAKYTWDEAVQCILTQAEEMDS